MKRMTSLFVLLVSILIVAFSSSYVYATMQYSQSIPSYGSIKYETLLAVVVGVNGGGATHLDDDAIDFANVLISTYGYPSSNIWLLTNSEATKANVISVLEQLRDRESSSSRVSIFFSAHGDYDKIYLYDEALWDYELSDILGDLESHNILVVINACHSGSFLDMADTISSGVFITACAANETTYDIALFANTIFIEYFVDRGMSQGLADENEDGLVTVEEAFRYARDKCNNPPGALPVTHPQMDDNYGGEYLLSAQELASKDLETSEFLDYLNSDYPNV